MSNIHNHNRDLIDLIIYKGDYWDFRLNEGMESDPSLNKNPNLSTNCLSVFIDTSDPDCVWMNSLYSKSDFIWDKSKCDENTQYNVGLTGVDNGFVKYDKYKITNKDFLELYTNTVLDFQYCDSRLLLSSVDGNNQIYLYPTDIVIDNNIPTILCNGGWFQGHFESVDGKYAVLPHSIGDGWVLETVIKPLSGQSSNGNTLNDIHPENRGIFLFIGARAENKWWKLYNVDKTSIDSNQYTEGYQEVISANNMTEYIKDPETKSKGLSYIDYGNMKSNDAAQIYDAPFDMSDYIENDIKLDNEKTIKTTDGFELGQSNIIEIETDNKFLLFDRSKNGLTVKDYKDGDTVSLHYVKKPKNVNYFTMFHHGKDGFTIRDIDKFIEENNKNYDIYQDLYRNAIGFQITNGGAIGFKYIVKDCGGNEPYKVESLFTRDGVVSIDEWHTISIKIDPIKQKNKFNGQSVCQPIVGVNDTMRISIYVDGMLRLVSKDLPMLNLRCLNDLPSRQWSVPFNLSIGGGTQGLCDVVYMDYMNTPTDILPLEKEFGGSFVGLLRAFRFYTCPLTFQEIQNNSMFDRTN